MTDLIILENEALKVIIDPDAGGKIRSFLSKKSGQEYLFQDPRSEFDASKGYSYHDITGYDECFPTVGPCKYPGDPWDGREVDDHGNLWQGPWKVERDGDLVEMSREVPEYECLFERTLTLEDGGSLRFDYRIKNKGVYPVKYVYSAHPLFLGTPRTELILPEEMERVYVYSATNIPGFEEGDWTDWPPPEESGLNQLLAAERNSCAKLFSPPLMEGKAGIRHGGTGERLEIDFDAETLPFLGILYVQGYDTLGDGVFKDSLFTAIEPTTGVGDEFPTCEANGTLLELEPRRDTKFWIRFSIIPEE